MTTEIDAELAEELVGLPASIDGALKKHHSFVRRPSGMIVCADPECNWFKLPGINIKRAWHKHQVWAVHMAVRDWYING